MRILQTSPFLPYPPTEGGRLLIWNEMRELAARGHDLEMVAPLRRPEDPGNLGALEELGRVVPVAVAARSDPRAAFDALRRGRSLRIERHTLPEVVQAFRERLRDSPPDLVFLDSLFTAYLEPVVREVRPDIPCVLQQQNVESQVFDRLVASPGRRGLGLLAGWERPRIRQAERLAVAAADRVVTLSEEDARSLAGPGVRCSVCGPGITTYAGESIAAPANPDTVLFIGSYAWPPNVDAASWMAREVWPVVRRRRPGARLVLAGSDRRGAIAGLASEAGGIEVAGFVDDAVATVRAAAVSVAPLLAGGGVRLKILEALANERPLVTTPVGAEGLGLDADEHARFAADAGSFAAAVVELLEDPAGAAAIARRGRAFVEANYSWTAAGDRLERILTEVQAAGHS